MTRALGFHAFGELRRLPPPLSLSLRDGGMSERIEGSAPQYGLGIGGYGFWVRVWGVRAVEEEVARAAVAGSRGLAHEERVDRLQRSRRRPRLARLPVGVQPYPIPPSPYSLHDIPHPYAR